MLSPEIGWRRRIRSHVAQGTEHAADLPFPAAVPVGRFERL
jgi:hypothetical protein